MKIVKTMCTRDCPDACWLDVTVENDTIIKIEASTENPFTNGITCPRAAGDPLRVTSMERVLYPYVRKPSPETGYNKVERSQALDLVEEKLKNTIKNHGRESVLLLDYAGNTGYLTIGYSKRLWNALGVTMTDYTVCSASGHAGIGLHYGLTYGQSPLDLEKKKNIVFWGFNAKTSSPHQWALATRARRVNDTKIIVVDPRESDTAELANLWICPKPGTDVALAYGIAHYLITNDMVDLDFIEKHTQGYADYKEEALKWTPERVQKVTGVSWKGVEEICLMLRGSPTVFMIGLGLNKSQTGAESCRAVSLLPALLGEHRGFYYTNSRGTIIDGDIYGGSLTEKKPKVVSLISIGERLAAGEFKFVYVVGMNPVLTLPDSHRLIEGFKREDCFLVVHDTHLTETAQLADVVLPATTYLEKTDVIVSDCHPFVRLANKAIEPLGESMDEYPLMLELSNRLGVSESWVHIDPWKDMEHNFRDAFIDGDFNDLLDGKSLQLYYRPIVEYQTPSGKIEFASNSVSGNISSLPKQLEVTVDDDEFIMLNSSLPQYTHTQFRDVYNDIPCTVWVNPVDAEKHSITDGEKRIIYNEKGELEVTVKITDRVIPGVIWAPRELIDEKGNPQNGLAQGTPQLIGGGPMFNTIKVRFKE
ncbi:MAG: molybdopterin-dependent oxidoreductase [Candidatus Bathyarchaeota archaeon]|nr:molybdopterin-dependent oxidoreductase [Candidatus Bathyarchaeota archaeon]